MLIRTISAARPLRWFKGRGEKMEKFSEHGVVPDVLSVAPTSVADVAWPSGAKAELGNVLTPTQMQDIPTVTWAAEESAFYTIIMTDPDAPSRKDPKYREWRHWVVVNVPGGDVSKGEVCAEYVGAGPPKGTGLHRYITLVYKQPAGRVQYTDTKLGLTAQGRPSTKAGDLATKYGLGNPVAGNFCQAEWDDYVPKLYEKLSS